MTETIGWGDVGVDEAPRRRRRLPFVLIWVVVAAVVGGIAIWPTAKSSLADGAAHWLQQEWNAAQAYDGSRTDIELAASQRVAVGDTATLVRLVQGLDREEADKLTAMATALGHHRMWAKNLDQVRTAVRRAYVAEAHDLRADVGAAPKELPGAIYVENPYTSDTEVLLERAETAVGAMATSRHLKNNDKTTATLSSASEEVTELQRVTTAPVDLRLAILHDSQLDVWDLRTGHARKNVLGRLPVDAPNELIAVGSSILAQSDVNWQLWPTAGPRTVSLPAESPSVFYQSDGSGGLWRTDGGRIRRYDAAGHPLGPWYRYPAGMEMDAIGATKDAIVGNLGALDYNEPHPVLWYPQEGRVVGFDDPCPGVYHVARRLIAFTSCDETSVRLLDTGNGRIRTVRLPRGLSLNGSEPVLSPDGSKLAMLAGPRSEDVDAPSLYVFDLKTSAITHVQTTAAPITWSPDGSVLLLDVNGDGFGPPTINAPASGAPLAYWKAGMTEPAGIRIDLSNGSFAVVAVP